MYTIKTHDGKSLSIKQDNPEKIKQLARTLELTAVTLADNSIIFLSKGTVARLERTSRTEADVVHRKPQQEKLLEDDKRTEDEKYESARKASERARQILSDKLGSKHDG